MNIIRRILCALCILIIMLGCGDEKEGKVQEQDKLVNLLVEGKWLMQSVVGAGVDQTNNYPGFEIQFFKVNAGSLRFTSSNGLPIWLNQGIATYSYDGLLSIVRSDGVDCVVQSVSESELVLEVSWDKTTLGPGRLNSVEGTYVFQFSH